MAAKELLHSELNADDFVFVQKLIFEMTGIALSETKRSLVQSRLSQRVQELNLNDVADYRRYLQTLPKSHPEWQAFINQLTTNKTEFFREIVHFEYLEKVFLPEWRKRGKKTLRIWSAACSTGEEPYTLAMLLNENLRSGEDFYIEATDIDTDVLGAAKNGVYHLSRLDGLPKRYREKYLIKGTDEIAEWAKVKSIVKQNIRFSQLNLIQFPYPWKEHFDLIFCRNVLIYFSPEVVSKVVNGLYSATDNHGMLFIGHSESLMNAKSGWEHVQPAIYRKQVNSSRPVIVPAEKKRRVLIVDDSKTIRELLTQVLSSDPFLEVVGTAENPLVAEKLIASLKPDVVTLDIQMPEMDGVTFLSKLLPRTPIPVVMVSSISKDESHQVLRALELGAVDYIQKPSFKEIKENASVICEKVKNASFAKVTIHKPAVRQSQPKHLEGKKLNIDKVLCVGASTGGTEAIKTFLEGLPDEIPPIVIVQHIPPVFSKAFADRLNSLFPFEIKEAVDGDVLSPGRVFIAPGGTQMSLIKRGANVCIRITDDPPVNRHKPSVDVMFNSAAHLLGSRAIGLLFTGMGNDGAKGLLQLRQVGAHTLAQDKTTSTVFGMPKAAIELGAAAVVCPLEKSAPQVIKWLTEK